MSITNPKRIAQNDRIVDAMPAWKKGSAVNKRTVETPTEIIAKLLGWKALTPSERQAWINSPENEMGGRYSNGKLFVGGNRWPDLEDWHDIRRMEDALAAKGVLTKYVSSIESLSMPTIEWQEQIETGAVSPYALQWREYHILRATVAQRVAAAVMVIEEAGL